MSSCRNKESALMNGVPASVAWSVIRSLDFTKLTPNIVKSCSLLVPPASHAPAVGKEAKSVVTLEGQEYQEFGMCEQSCFHSPLSIGSLRHVVYKDGAEFVFRLVELSDVDSLVSCELIQTDATVNVSGVHHTWEVIEITETKECVVSWTTEFSSDVDQHVYSDCKYKKLDAFKALRTILQKHVR